MAKKNAIVFPQTQFTNFDTPGYDLLNLFGGFVGKCNYMISFSNFKCTPPLSELFFSTNYIVRPCAFASYIVYFLLWLKIKEELRKAVNDEQKKRNLEQGK